MEIVNMKKITIAILRSVDSIKKSGADYPSSWNTFPLAIYRTVSKPHFKDNRGTELQTFWTIAIELYSDNTSLAPVANEVVARFGEIGFTGNSKDANTAGLKRIVLEFTGIVDNGLKRVFSK